MKELKKKRVFLFFIHKDIFFLESLTKYAKTTSKFAAKVPFLIQTYPANFVGTRDVDFRIPLE